MSNVHEEMSALLEANPFTSEDVLKVIHLIESGLAILGPDVGADPTHTPAFIDASRRSLANNVFPQDNGVANVIKAVVFAYDNDEQKDTTTLNGIIATLAMLGIVTMSKEAQA